MRHTIPSGGWTALANAIESADDGDTILVYSAAMQEVAERAHQRICSDKNLVFEIQAPPNPLAD